MTPMTAALPEYEYEVPPHGAPPSDAVERVVEGSVVYLKRDGERVAVMESVELRWQNLRQRAEYLRRRVDQLTIALVNVSEGPKPGYPEDKRHQIMKVLEDVIAAAEDEFDVASAQAAVANPEPPIPHEQVMRELGLTDAS